MHHGHPRCYARRPTPPSPSLPPSPLNTPSSHHHSSHHTASCDHDPQWAACLASPRLTWQVRAFVERARRGVAARLGMGFEVSSAALKRADTGPRVWNRQEDMVLGFWLSRAERRGLFNVTWVRINDRSKNMGCLSTKGMYQRPRDDTVSVHNLKLRGGLDYIYGLLHDGIAHSGENCTRWVWYDNCRTLKGGRVQEWCAKNCQSKPCALDLLDPNFVSKPVRGEDQPKLGAKDAGGVVALPRPPTVPKREQRRAKWRAGRHHSAVRAPPET